MSLDNHPADGTVLAPTYYEGPTDVNDDVRLQQRYFTYKTDVGWMAGKTFDVTFTVDRPVKEVWPHLKDFNRWQNAYGDYYSGVVGELEGKSFRISDKPGDSGPHQFHVLRVIPESMIVVSRPAAEEGSSGAIGAGFYVVMLSERGGKTVVTLLMENDRRKPGLTEEEGLEFWRKVAPESQRKWRDSFIPTLKKLIDEPSGP